MILRIIIRAALLFLSGITVTKLSRSIAGGARRLLGAALLATAAVGPLALAQPALAQSGAAAGYEIPAQPLSSALAAFSDQSGYQVTINGALVRGQRSEGVSGSMSAGQALSRLLAGSGLSYKIVGGVVTLEPTPGSDGAVALGRLRVEGGTDQTGASGASGDAPYETAAPVSSIGSEELQTRFSGNPQTALRATPGVSTRQSSSQPGIEVNIRGMSGYGRVNAMIDGVPQAFKNVAGHEASGGSLLYIQPELLAGIDVTRGAVAGAHGSGTLTGAANFRTLSLDDVLLDGQTTGGMARLKFGDNGADFAGSISGGARFDGLWGGDGRIDVFAGVAYSETGNYKGGDGTTIPAARQSSNAPQGGLLKVTVSPNQDHDFSVGVRLYENQFNNSSYNWAVDNKTWTADYRYTPGGNWLNLAVSAYYNDTHLQYVGTTGSFAGRETRNEGYGLNATNQSKFVLGDDVDVRLSYGFSWGREDFQTIAKRGGNHPGKLDKSSLFSDAEFDFGRYSLIAGLRYDAWKMEGYRPTYAAGTGDCPGPVGGPACGNDWVGRDGGEWLPKVGVVYQATKDLELYATYSHTFRPPTTHEVFFSLVPLGNGVGSGVANNLDLDAETNKGWDLGANFKRSGIFRDGDHLRFKIGYFHNDIENFIVNDFVDVPGRGLTAMWVNRPGETVMQGLEIEGGYDARFAYANFAFAKTDTDQPVGDGAGAGNGEGSVLPDTTATLDAGVRLFDRKLILGAQARYTGEGQVAQFGVGWTPTDSYTLVDLYGSYAVNERAEVFFSVENVEDKIYGYAASSLGAHTALTGRGRTFIAGLTARF